MTTTSATSPLIDRVLVLGAGGQLGYELRHSVPEGVQCVALDRTSLDITDLGAIRAAVEHHAPQAIINAAAYTAVDRAEEESERAWAINCEGPKHLAQICAATGIRLLHVSTDFVFDGASGQPYAVDAAVNPLGVYGASKRGGELAVLDSGADALVVRTGWVYSAHGGNFVKTMLRLMADRPSLTVVEDQIGTPTWAHGLADVCWQLCADPHAYGIYHWSDAGACSWYDFAVAIREEAMALGLLKAAADIAPIPATDYPTPATRPAYSVLDKSRTRSQLNISGQHWRVALRDMLQSLAESSSE